MVLLIASAILTAVALIRNGRAWGWVLTAWIAMGIVTFTVVLPLQVRAENEYRSGYTTGSTLQGFGPFGGALGAGIAAQSAADAQRMMAIAQTVDIAASVGLIIFLVLIAARSPNGTAPAATANFREVTCQHCGAIALARGQSYVCRACGFDCTEFNEAPASGETYRG